MTDDAVPVVRLATVADAPAIAALVQSAYRGDASRGGWTTEADLLDGMRISAAEVRELITEPDTVVLVVDDADDIPLVCCELRDRGHGVAYFGMFSVQPGRQAAASGGTRRAWPCRSSASAPS